MDNLIVERAKTFLKSKNSSDLKELAFCNCLEAIPDDHIMREFVDFVYEGAEMPFNSGMISLYPFIAQECYIRYLNTQRLYGALKDIFNSRYGGCQM